MPRTAQFNDKWVGAPRDDLECHCDLCTSKCAKIIHALMIPWVITFYLLLFLFAFVDSEVLLDMGLAWLVGLTAHSVAVACLVLYSD